MTAPEAAPEVALRVSGLEAGYGRLPVLFGVDLTVAVGESVAVLGANGAGKTTLLTCIAGLLTPTAGTLHLRGTDLGGLSVEQRVRLGMVQVQGGNAIFPSLTLDEHLSVAAAGLAPGVSFTDRCGEVLASFPQLEPLRGQRVGTMSGGQRQMVALAKALLPDPWLLVVDELSLGLAPLVVEQLAAVLRGLRAKGTTLLVVEQSLDIAAAVADRAVFLEKGAVRFDGSLAELAGEGDLAKAIYLGAGGGAMIGALTFRSDLFVIGLIAGLGYAVLAAGLMLVYRAKRVLNLAHGQIGALCAGVLVVLHDHNGWPYGFALLAAVVLGGAIGLVVDLGIARRLTKRSTLAVLVATIGVSQLLLVAQFKLPRVDGLVFPTPFDATLTVGNVILHSEHLMLLAFGPITLLALAAFLRRSRTGLHIRAVADNDDAARLAGVSSAKVETLVWTLAGVLAAVAAILTVPLAGLGGGVGTGALGPALLLRALAAGLAGRLERVRPMLVAAIAIGIVEAILQASYPHEPGLTDAVLFVFVLVLLVVRGRSGAEATGDGDAGAVAVDPVPLPVAVRDHPRVKLARRALTLAVFAVVVALPLVFTTSAQLFRLSRVPIFALIGLSVVVLTGWTGQLSLGQSAFVGIGALGTAALELRGVPFGAALAYSTVAGVAVAIAVGAPALRIRGLYLAVSTLAFGVATSTYLLGLGFLGSGGGRPITVRPGQLGPLDLNHYRTMYFLCAGLCAVVAVALARARRTAVGRSMVAVECNDRAAAALTTSPAVARLTAFALSGGLAALAGGLLGGVTRSFSADVFNPDLSFQVLAMAVIGGVGSVGGAVIGACYLVGLPVLFGGSNVSALATSGIGLLVLLLVEPRGLVGLLNRVRDPIAYRLAGADGQGPAADAVGAAAAGAAGGWDEATGGPPERRLPAVRATVEQRDPAGPVLGAEGLEVRLGGRTILDGVDFTVGAGEIVGLIGTNGAGKTTVLNAVGGMVRSVGTVHLDGTDISGWRPHERAAFGLGRSFQDARLFPRLTVRECVELAGERHHRVELVPTLLALAPSVRAERAARHDADELLGLLGLDRFADALAGSLSTGTRRLVELAQLVALQPKVVLLDEPTAGLAAAESEAFAGLIRAVRDELATPVLVIEHDVRLMLGLCDRLYCLEAGSVIAEGPPEVIRDDPGVIASYLGRTAAAAAPASTAATAAAGGGSE